MTDVRALAASLALALAACSSEAGDPVAAPDAAQLGDASADGLAAPANASAAEAHQAAATPLSTDEMRWKAGDPGTATFGPAGGDALLSFKCSDSRIIIIRHSTGSAGTTGTLSFTGNGKAASLPVQASSSPTGGRGQWQADLVPGDLTNAVARVFDGRGPVEVTLGGTADLVAPPDDAPARVLARCGSPGGKAR